MQCPYCPKESYDDDNVQAIRDFQSENNRLKNQADFDEIEQGVMNNLYLDECNQCKGRFLYYHVIFKKPYIFTEEWYQNYKNKVLGLDDELHYLPKQLKLAYKEIQKIQNEHNWEYRFSALRKALFVYFEIKGITNHKSAKKLKENIKTVGDLRDYAEALYILKYIGNKGTHSEEEKNQNYIKNLDDKYKEKVTQFFFKLCQRDFITPGKIKQKENECKKMKAQYDQKIAKYDQEIKALNDDLNRIAKSLVLK